jgi:hypothetical protein
MPALRGICSDQRQIRRDEGPFFIADITWLGFAWSRWCWWSSHASILSPTPGRVHNSL